MKQFSETAINTSELLGNWLDGLAPAMLAAAAGACAVFAFELAVAVRLLGRRIERFDLSQELR